MQILFNQYVKQERKKQTSSAAKLTKFFEKKVMTCEDTLISSRQNTWPYNCWFVIKHSLRYLAIVFRLGTKLFRWYESIVRKVNRLVSYWPRRQAEVTAGLEMTEWDTRKHCVYDTCAYKLYTDVNCGLLHILYILYISRYFVIGCS